MDHHCPWTNNCVSHFTYPHFLRFVFYAVISMIYLEYLLYERLAILWGNRHLPSYLGPSIIQLGHLLSLAGVNSVVLFALSILLSRTLWILLQNQTTIEGWEIERHRTLVRRARVFGGYLDGPDGTKIRIQKQEFPYDIGIWRNIQDNMGTGNFFSWFWPFSPSPRPGTGLEFEVNGFDDPSLSWPPPDPDRMYRHVLPNGKCQNDMTLGQQNFDQDDIDAFRRRQELDYQRYQTEAGVMRRKPFHQRYTDNINTEYISDPSNSVKGYYSSDSGEEGWRNSDGDRLRDFGVDEEAEFYDEDDVPLAVLIERRKNKKDLAARTEPAAKSSTKPSDPNSHLWE
ncbi:conserved hypothetical protein [Uncinocarpus reesii 1704]|uniref:Palmitoyltransferase n=1 Tax=Uncinocarpus reesii (strain UAMH 1704) TaxID=336963 RepID=C4JHN0_UNCRE|nr:uncharacterized protein UREG_02716 [Uncinocarpus reesii 1704]EEP77867.1 conserved hypothetical protein [Uncinocarpus reesii 1704]